MILQVDETTRNVLCAELVESWKLYNKARNDLVEAGMHLKNMSEILLDNNSFVQLPQGFGGQENVRREI